MKAGPEHRVDCEVGAGDRSYERTLVDAIDEIELSDAGSPVAEHARGDATVGAVVALPAHHDDPAAVGPPEHPASLERDRAARAFDEDRFGCPGCSRAPVGLGHLGGRDDRAHALHSSARRTTGSVRRSTRSICASTSSRITGSVSVTWSAMAWYRSRYPSSTRRATLAGSRPWKRTCISVRPVVWLPLTSGTSTNVRPSARPRTTVTSRSVAARCLVPRNTGFVSVRERMSRAMPPRSTTAIVESSML